MHSNLAAFIISKFVSMLKPKFSPGLHATLTQVLNDDNFRELILAYHYVIAIGAFLAPFLGKKTFCI